jgi:UDP-2,3-diacylglucosamine hydrolase
LNKDKIYFASDFHLGAPNKHESKTREKLIVKWLSEIEHDAKAIYLLGDIFDFWFEYSKVVPKGFVRLLGKLASITDNGTEVHFFVGNHDLWAKDYLKKEVGINIHRQPKTIEEQGKRIFIGHGDGLGKGDYLYKFLRKIFTSKICQWAFARLHPNLALSIAHAASNSSRRKHKSIFVSEEKEILFNYCKKQQKIRSSNYYIFGHRHVPLELKIHNDATYINLGDWIDHNTFAVLENGTIKLEEYKY